MRPTFIYIVNKLIKTFMKLFKKLSVAVYAVLLATMTLMPFSVAHAAGVLTTPRDYLSRVAENLASGEVHQVFFTTASAVAGGGTSNKIIIVFPNADDGKWCATAGIDLVATGITNPTGGSESATALPGTLTAKCVKGTDVSSYDTITVEAVTDLAGTTKYGVEIKQKASSPTALLGTPANTTDGLITVKTNNGSADVDTAQVAVDIIANDQVNVSATVPPSITFAVSATSINLGTLSTGAVASASHTVRTITNAANGYATYVYSDGNLRNGSNTIAATTGTLVAATAGYGIATQDTGQTIHSDAACNSSPSNTVSALTTAQQSVAGATSGPVDETIYVCYEAAISSLTIAGNYTQTVTYVTVGLF